MRKFAERASASGIFYSRYKERKVKGRTVLKKGVE
jgi:hypothetical protein